MARRDENLLEVLADAPWWVSIAFGMVFYGALRFGLPLLSSGNAFSDAITKPISQLAWMSVIFVIPAGVALVRSAGKRRMLDGQCGIDSVRALSWKQFEELLGEAYRRQGFSVLENPGKGADGGVDLTIRRSGATYLVQCKQWRTYKVGVKVVREMLGLVSAHGAAGAIVVTSGSFTKEARDFAASQPIELVDGDDLAKLIGSVQTQSAMAAPVTADVSHPCPRCGEDLVLREARRGSNAGSKFWGCSAYPKCRYTESAAG